MSDVMELEARLKNYITPELEKISNSMDSLAGSTSKGTKEIESGFDGLNKTTGILLKSFLGLASARQAIRFFFECRDAAQDYQKVQLQLKASLGYTSAALNAQADALMKKLTIDDEQITSIQTAISYFTKDEEQIKKLTKASLDFAAATGIDGVSAARLLGRSIEYQDRMLARYGITVNKSGGELKKIDSIIDGVNKRFGGQAEALAQSNDLWDKFKLTIGETKEAIGLFMKSDFWTGKIENKGAEYVAFMEYNYKNAKKILENADSYSAEVVARAKARISEYESDPAIKEGRSARFKNDMSKYFEDMKKSNELTIKMQEELWDLTDSGKIKNLENQMNKELLNKEYTEQQKYLITEKYEYKINELRKKISEEQNKKDNELDRQARELFDLEIKRRMDDSEAEEKANEDHVNLMNERIVSIMNWNNKVHEKEKKDAHDQMELDKKKAKQKIENIQYAADASFETMGAIAKATKMGSAAQKTIDIAQATANMALGISKALAPGLQWQIPFIAALGAAQIATIASQKYAYGGIVPGNQTAGDRIPAMVNSREMILTMGQQSTLFDMLSRPNNIYNSSANNVLSNESSNINLNISVGGGNYDMKAAQFTVDQLIPVLGDALVRAKNEGRLRQYETAR